MAKRKKLNNNMLFTLGMVASAVIIVVMMFLTAVIYKGNNTESSFLGTEIVFGKTVSDLTVNGNGTKTFIPFNFLLLLGFFLPIITSVVAAFVGKKGKMIVGLVCAVVFIFSAIMMFVSPQLASMVTEITLADRVKTSTSTLASLDYTLSFGTVIAGVLGILGAVCSIGYGFLK